uniref:Uncharacterized protein n=1 Tax=viral metagenome TaxID=1070528 RepID=A0A6C0KBJ2_9ZZZZ
MSKLESFVQAQRGELDTAMVNCFGRLLIGTLGKISEIFPTSEDVKNAQNKTQLLFSNPIFGLRFVATWHESMVAAVDVSLSYAPAYERLTSRPIDYYAVARYRDHQVLFSNKALVSSIDCELHDKFEHPDFQPERKWLFAAVDQLNFLAQATQLYTLPDMPSREEITANIQAEKRKKETRSERGDAEMSASMLCEALSAAAAADSLPADLSGQLRALADETKVSTRRGRDAMALQEQLSGLDPGFAQRDESDKIETLLAMQHPLMQSKCVQQFLREGHTDAQRAFTEALGRFVSFNSIAGGISTNLLQSVQDEITGIDGLVDDTGNVDMSKIDLASLVPNLMAKVDPGDLQDMAGNIHTMLPELQKMTSGMQGGNDGNPMGDMMQQVMSMAQSK